MDYWIFPGVPLAGATLLAAVGTWLKRREARSNLREASECLAVLRNAKQFAWLNTYMPHYWGSLICYLNRFGPYNTKDPNRTTMDPSVIGTSYEELVDLQHLAYTFECRRYLHDIRTIGFGGSMWHFGGLLRNSGKTYRELGTSEEEILKAQLRYDYGTRAFSRHGWRRLVDLRLAAYRKKAAQRS